MDDGNNVKSLEYVEQQEKTSIAYARVGDKSKTLVISFGSNYHAGFMRKTSLIDLKYNKKYDFDIFYLRNKHKWYLGRLNGIGKNISDTISFLKEQTQNYKKIITIGSSAGGYASFLFGSYINADVSIAIDPQTDLEYLVERLPKKNGPANNLRYLKEHDKNTWKKFSNLKNILSPNVKYYMCCKNGRDVLHGVHHYNVIKECSSVNLKNEIKKDMGLSLLRKSLNN
jgi:hypothetical protein